MEVKNSEDKAQIRREIQRRYYLKNKEKLINYQVRWQQKNKDKHCEYTRKWREGLKKNEQGNEECMISV